VLLAAAVVGPYIHGRTVMLHRNPGPRSGWVSSSRTSGTTSGGLPCGIPWWRRCWTRPGNSAVPIRPRLPTSSCGRRPRCPPRSSGSFPTGFRWRPWSTAWDPAPRRVPRRGAGGRRFRPLCELGRTLPARGRRRPTVRQASSRPDERILPAPLPQPLRLRPVELRARTRAGDLPRSRSPLRRSHLLRVHLSRLLPGTRPGGARYILTSPTTSGSGIRPRPTSISR